MRNILCRVSALLLALLLLLTMVPGAAAADEAAAYQPAITTGVDGSVTAIIPMTLVVKGSAPRKDLEYYFRLTPKDGAPVPNLSDSEPSVELYTDEKTGDQYYRMTLTVNGTTEGVRADWTATFDRVGVYEYTLEQITTAKHSRCRYDTRVFNITVTVTNAYDEDGNDLNLLQATVVARVADSTDKTDIVFTNRFSSPSSGGDDPKPKPETPEKTYLEVDKVWSGTSKTRPGSVTIQLLDGNTILDTVTLGDWNNWHYSWHDLDGSGSHDWNVKELEVPEGYSVSYSFDGTTFTVRNTETLIQTGQLNWPVPVLGAAGLALVVAGLLMLRKKKES